MYNESEFTGALTAIVESLGDSVFDRIMDETSTVMDYIPSLNENEAVSYAAASLFNDGVIDEASFAVVDAVMNEYANRPATYQDVIDTMAGSLDEAAFDQFMGAVANYILEERAMGSVEAKERADAKSRITANRDSIRSVNDAIKQVKRTGTDTAAKRAAVSQLKEQRKTLKSNIRQDQKFLHPNAGRNTAIGVGGAAVLGAGALAAHDAVKHGDALYTVKKARDRVRGAFRKDSDSTNESTALTIADLRAMMAE